MMREEQQRFSEEQTKQRAEETRQFLERMDEQKKQLEEERALREASIARAEEALQEAKNREDDLAAAVRMFSSGFSPVLWPTAKEIEQAERRLEPREGHFHIAIAGNSGTGKSSLINAIRGVKNNDKIHAASVGVTETTTGVGRYPDPTVSGPRSRFVWYDIPGAGTLLKPGPKYFNEHGLFVFDLIIVMFGGRFTQQDLAILEHCARFKVPTFLVRSKSNQYIENIIKEELDYEGIHVGPVFQQCYIQARDQYIRETRQTVRQNLAMGEYHDPSKKIYLVSAVAIRAYVTGGDETNLAPTSRLIDEEQLLEDIAKTIVERRFTPSEEEIAHSETGLESKIRDAVHFVRSMGRQKGRR